MKRLIALFFLALQAGASPIAIRNVTVIDGTGAPPRRNVTVLIRGGKIASVNASRIPRGATVIDGTNRFLIPGLWDMHTHVWEEKQLALFIANGITGIRDMGAELKRWPGWRARIERGELIGPRAVVAGQIIDALKPRYYGWTQVTTPDEARATVARLQQEGADFIKVYDRLSRDTYFAAAEEANRRGLVFAGHVPSDVPVSEAARAGQRSVEHLVGIALEASSDEAKLRAQAAPLRTEETLTDFYRVTKYDPLPSIDRAKLARLLAVLRKERVWQTPTLVVRRPVDEVLAKELETQLAHFPDFLRPMVLPKQSGGTAEHFKTHLELVREMHRAGVPLLAGSDGGNPGSVPAFSLHDELALFVDAGLTPLEALQTATRNAADYLGLLKTHGTIERGKVADLVLLSHDPLKDIRNTKKVVAVIAGGKVVHGVERLAK